jgi:hypothetical protein
MGGMGGKRIYDEIDDTKKTIQKPEDDEEEEKIKNLDDDAEKEPLDMDALLGGDGDETPEERVEREIAEDEAAEKAAEEKAEKDKIEAIRVEKRLAEIAVEKELVAKLEALIK